MKHMELYFIYTKKDEFTNGGIRVFAGYEVRVNGKIVSGGEYTPRFEDAVFFSTWEDAKNNLDVSNGEVIDTIDSSNLPFEPYIYGNSNRRPS